MLRLQLLKTTSRSRDSQQQVNKHQALKKTVFELCSSNWNDRNIYHLHTKLRLFDAAYLGLLGDIMLRP